jgi:hypothetical protein
MALFCAVALFLLVYRDLAVPDAGRVEVWFGFELHDIWARRTAPIHWAIFGAGAVAFWRSWSPIWRVAIGYAVYIALSHLIWNLTSESGGGLDAGLIQLVLFSLPALAIWLLARSALNRAHASSVTGSDPPRRR